MRITPAQVVEAYRATGLKPIQHLDFDGTGACGLVTLCRHTTSHNVKNSFPASEHLGLECEYGAGFIHGWDNDGVARTGSQFDGYVDGQAAWQACVDAGLVEVTSDASD